MFRLFSVGIEKGDRMMKYDFDQIINRRGTSCLKYDFAVERGKREDVLPLWVADMDFRVAEPILKRLHACVDHGIFGYSEAKDDYFQAVAGWTVVPSSARMVKASNESISPARGHFLCGWRDL